MWLGPDPNATLSGPANGAGALATDTMACPATSNTTVADTVFRGPFSQPSVDTLVPLWHHQHTFDEATGNPVASSVARWAADTDLVGIPAMRRYRGRKHGGGLGWSGYSVAFVKMMTGISRVVFFW